MANCTVQSWMALDRGIKCYRGPKKKNLLIALAGRMRFCFSFGGSGTMPIFGQAFCITQRELCVVVLHLITFSVAILKQTNKKPVLRPSPAGCDRPLCSQGSDGKDLPSYCEVSQRSCLSVILLQPPGPVSS